MSKRVARDSPGLGQTNRAFGGVRAGVSVTNRLNVINLNSTARVDTAGNITTPATLAPTATRDQRLLQLGARFNW